ncbi:MAG: ABC transporter permease [Phycisphaerales bacterium]|nr:ABC transporter permease [Phycisphaerales bacterium]
MILSLIRTGLIELRRDKVALGLTFVLPILFYSIFAIVFGQMGNAAATRVEVIIVDEDGTEGSRRLAAAIDAEPALRVRGRTDDAGAPLPWSRAEARDQVERGEVPVAIILPEGFGATLGRFYGDVVPIDMLLDTADPIAGQLVGGMLQKTAFVAMPDLMVDQGLSAFEEYAGPLTGTQKLAVASLKTLLYNQRPDAEASDTETTDEAPAFNGPVSVNTIDVHQKAEKKKNPTISFYAAGTGVMFLLFAAAGAGGALLDEQDNGTLERVLSSRMTMTGLLTSKWLLIAGIGTAQVTVMFVWGALVFGLPLTDHLAGFTIMTLTTAMAASAFGLVLATACRSRAQLSGLSTIIILIMSAIGGSMFPRFMMPEFMHKLGLITFNAWALDGYQKVFWHDVPPLQLWPQVGVLLAITVALLTLARAFARRWEAS